MPRPPSTPMISIIINTAGGSPPPARHHPYFFFLPAFFFFAIQSHPLSLQGIPASAQITTSISSLIYLFFLPAFFFFAIQSHPLSSHPPRPCPGDGLYTIRGAPEGPSHRRAWLRPRPIVRRCSASTRAHTRKSGDLPIPRNAAPSSGPARGRRARSPRPHR